MPESWSHWYINPQRSREIIQRLKICLQRLSILGFSHGIYSSKSIYNAHFVTSTTCETSNAIWGSWAPLRYKIAT
jgi:hypothetical protein